MGSFRVLKSTYTDLNGVVHGPGTEFDSDLPLDTQFANKFLRLDKPNARPRDRDSRLNESGGKAGDRPAEERMPPGSEPRAATHGRKDAVKANPVDIDYPDAETDGAGENPVGGGRANTTLRGQPPTATGRGRTGRSAVPESPAADEVDDDNDGVGELGADVTEEFEVGDKNVRVFQTDAGFAVASADDPATPLDGGDALRNKTAVKKFLKDFTPAETTEGDDDTGE